MTGRPFRGQWGVVLATILSFAAGWARADTDVLSCTENPTPGTAWSCENFGTVAAQANVTYQLAVQPSDATYQRFDIDITLTSLSGDADLCGPRCRAVFSLAQQHMPARMGSARRPAHRILCACTAHKPCRQAQPALVREMLREVHILDPESAERACAAGAGAAAGGPVCADT